MKRNEVLEVLKVSLARVDGPSPGFMPSKSNSVVMVLYDVRNGIVK